MEHIDYRDINNFIKILDYYMEPCISYKNELYWVSWSMDKKILFFANNYGRLQEFSSIDDFLKNATTNDGKILSEIWNDIDEIIA